MGFQINGRSVTLVVDGEIKLDAIHDLIHETKAAQAEGDSDQAYLHRLDAAAAASGFRVVANPTSSSPANLSLLVLPRE